MCRDRISPRRSFSPGVTATEASSALVFARHTHDEFGVGVICRGAQRSASGRGPVEAGPGNVITVNPGEVHDGTPIGERRAWRMLYVAPDMLREAAQERGLDVPGWVELRRPVIQDALLAARFESAFAAITSPLADAPSRETALVALLDRLLGAYASCRPREGGKARGAIARARQRIDDDPATDASLAVLAAEARLSRFQLLRAFQRETGLTPQSYRRVRRVQRARDLVRAGIGLAEAAACVGFADQSHMNRAFLRVTGATPGAWARAAG
jgi:AraC-like DNA-binding protein